MTIQINGTSGISGVDGSAGTPALQGSDTNTGISFGTDTVNINTGGTTRATVDSSGRVLVGTSTAAGNFFNGSSSTQMQIGGSASLSLTQGANDAFGSYCIFAKSRSSGNTIVQSGDQIGLISFQGNDGSEHVEAATIQAVVDGTPGANDMPGRLVFSTTADGASSPTERMRINNAGEMLIGKTTNNVGAAEGTIVDKAGFVAMTNNASTNAWNTLNIYSIGAGQYRFYVGGGGTVYATNTTISSASDVRLKENIRDLDVGLDAILALRPRKFDWKEGKGKDIKNDRGFIAQEFEQIFPDLIDEWRDPPPEGEEPYKSVRQDLIPVLVKAIQEQQAMIVELQAEVAALKAQ